MGKSVSELKEDLRKLKKQVKEKEERIALQNKIQKARQKLGVDDGGRDIRHKTRKKLGPKISSMLDNLAKSF